MRTPRRSWTSRSRPLASDRPQGNSGGVSAILKSRQARSARSGTAGATGLSPSSSQAMLILSRQPRAGTSSACRRRIAASARIGRDEVDGAIDEFHQPRRPFRLQVRVDVEDDAVGVLPLGRLPADFLQFQISAVLAERPEPHVRQIPPLVRIAEHGELLADVAQPVDEPFGHPARGG